MNTKGNKPIEVCTTNKKINIPNNNEVYSKNRQTKYNKSNSYTKNKLCRLTKKSIQKILNSDTVRYKQYIKRNRVQKENTINKKGKPI